MTDFTDAIRDDTSLLIAIAGASGSGKTFSALTMATGLAQGEPIYAIDTEAKRMLHYADVFRFKHMDMKPPFTPETYIEAIQKAERAGAKVIIIDSTSDEYEGVGGLQEMHDDEVSRLARKPYDRLEGWEIDKFNAPAWKVPKTRHKTRLMSPLRQVRAYIIFCLRAEEKIKFVKVPGENGREKTAIQNAGWVPICEKRFMFEMTMSFTVTPDNPGVPLIEDGQAVYGKIQSQHLHLFPPGKRVTAESGRLLRAWARGESTNTPSRPADLPKQNEQGAGTLSSSQQPAPAHNIELLTEYHGTLAAETEARGLKTASDSFKSRFGPDDIKMAEIVFRAHRDRIKGLADADATTTFVMGKIDGD